MQNENIKNLDGLAVISIDLDIWSGQTKLQDIDLSLADEYNNEVVNLGNKRLVSREALKPFERLKSAVRRNMLRRGIQFLNGYAVPVEQMDEVVEEIEGWRLQFDQAVTDFLASYSGNVEAWISQNPSDEAVIRRGTLPLEAVEKRFGFAWDAFHVQSVDNASAQSQLDSSAGQLGNKLIADIQQTARDFWDRSLSGRAMVGTTCVMTLREMKRKLESLAFLDYRSRPLIALLDGVITQSERAESRTGRNFVDPFFSQMVAAVLVLADRSRMQEYLDGYHSSQDEVQESLQVEETSEEAPEEQVTVEPEAASVVQAEPEVEVAVAQEIVVQPSLGGDDFLDALAEMAGISADVEISVPAPKAKQKETPAEPIAEAHVVTEEPAQAAQPEPQPEMELEPQQQQVAEPAVEVAPAQQEQEPAAEADFGFGFDSSNVVGW